MCLQFESRFLHHFFAFFRKVRTITLRYIPLYQKYLQNLVFSKENQFTLTLNTSHFSCLAFAFQYSAFYVSEKQPYLPVQISLGRDGSPSRPGLLAVVSGNSFLIFFAVFHYRPLTTVIYCYIIDIKHNG